MRRERLAIVVGLLILLGMIISCSPSKVNSSSAGTVITGPTTTASSATALALTANPSTIAPSGSTVITAHVVDNLGNNVPDGTVVSFSFAPGDQVKARLSAGSATTVSGTASITLTATTFSSSVVTINAVSGVAAASDVITITSGAASGSVTVSANPATISVGNTSNVSASVRDNGGNPVANATVTFSLSNNTLATLSQTSVNTDATGVATTVLTGSAAGNATVTAAVQSLGGTSGQASITINPVATVPTMTVSTTASSILTNGTTTISAVLSGFSPVDGLPVIFNISNPAAGYLSSPTTTGQSITVNTAGGGIASVMLHAYNIASPSVDVNVSYSARSLSGKATITITAPPADTITVSPNQTPITVFGTSTITAIVTGGGRPVPDGTLVNFIIQDSTFGNLSNAVGSTVGGSASTTFSAVSKVGPVTISATSGGASGTTTVSINAADAGSIQFVSAVPQVIGIQGSGQSESSTITFAIKDINGNPVADGTTVTFAMNGPGGGSYIGSIISSQTATASTIKGSASVILHSGSTAGPVTIIATAKVSPTSSSTISSSSTQVSIGGGVPSAGHWNLSTSQFNLTGLSISGLEATISTYIADRFGNYNILTGTAINFYTEAGAIDAQGITDSTGKSSVILRTQAPNPVDVSNALAGDPVSNRNFAGLAEPWYPGGNNTYNNNPRDGWVTVLATTMGEEAFLDENGDGLFTRSASASACPDGYTCECDNNGAANTYAGHVTGPAACAPTFGASSKRSEGFVDLGEPFYDKNDSGTRDNGAVAGTPFEEFIDANLNGVYDGPNGVWDGPGCQSTGCLTSKMIWKEIKLVFTYDVFSFWPDGDANKCYSSTGGCTASFSVNDTNVDPKFSVAPASISKGSSGYFCVNVADANLNSPPGGTVINAVASPGTVTPASVTIPDGLSYGPAPFCFTVAIDSAATAPNTLVSVSVANTPMLASLTVQLGLPPAPTAPTNVQATPLPTAGQIRLSWNAVNGATVYNVYYSTLPGVTKLNGTQLTPQPTASPANITGLTTGTTYYFVVTAVGPGGESSDSIQASAVAP
jgi:Bacterial Ig-like domain (group 1)/Fibronectin type III domain